MKTDLSSIKIARLKKQQRQFMIAIGIFLIGMGGWLLYRSRLPLGMTFLCSGLLLGSCELFLPKVAHVIFTGWMKFARALGFVNTFLLLSLIYLIVLWPLATLKKWVQRSTPPPEDFFRKRHSSWVDLSPSTQEPERYYQPY